MAEIKLLRDTALQTIIANGAALTNNSRKAADYDNGAELDLGCDVYLTDLSYSATPPAAGDAVAELYLLPGDGEATEVFPEGGDGTVGDNVDPQKIFLVGVFETRQPSDTVVEVLALPGIPLYGKGNRFIIKNIGGDTWDANWDLKIKPYKLQTV